MKTPKTTKIYIIPISATASTLKAGAHIVNKKGDLQPIWPSDCIDFNHTDDKSHDKCAKKMSMSIQNKKGNEPKFCFKSNAIGYDRRHDIMKMIEHLFVKKQLKTDNFNLKGKFEVYYITPGFYPSLVDIFEVK